jgi:pyruvate,water dikinase
MSRSEEDLVVEEAILVRGLGVNRGRSSGKVRVILNLDDISRLRKGDILVTDMTIPDWVSALPLASAIVAELGGATSHAAILGRELGIPTVVGCDDAIKVLKEGQMVTVDGQKGLVCGKAADHRTMGTHSIQRSNHGEKDNPV